jgi:hypothetical protein
MEIFMFTIDQYMRSIWKTAYNNQYTADETKFFNEQFFPRSNEMDRQNTEDLKDLLKLYEWFKVSEWLESFMPDFQSRSPNALQASS